MPDAFRLDGKTALVTGAGRGIGRGIALALAGAGASVILNSRSPAELDAVAAEITVAGGTARTLPFDVTDADATKTAFTQIAKEPGRLDILVNNAG
ncbi:MAG TPA: SDR family NAD(P)-dependent oxidoreductase, partial [Stellaceae bacterium]